MGKRGFLSPAAAAIPQNHRGTSAEGAALGDPSNFPSHLEEKNPTHHTCSILYINANAS